MTQPIAVPAPAKVESHIKDVRSPEFQDPGVPEEVGASPFSLEAFRGSTLWYTQSFSAISLDKTAEPSYEPTYSHRLSLRPVWQFSKRFQARARFDLNQDLVDNAATDTTYKYQVLPSDLSIDVGTSFKEPHTGIEIAPAIRMGFPTSLASRAASMYFSIAPLVNVNKTFNVLKGLSFGYLFRIGKYVSHYQTATLNGQTIPCSDPRGGCEQFVQGGARTTSWGIAHGPSASLSITDRLSIDFVTWFLYSELYPLAPGTNPVTGTTINDDNGVNSRLNILTALDATYNIGRGISVSAGAYTYSGEPGPDGLYRNPFVNRYTSLSVDLIVDIVSLIRGEPKPVPETH